MRKIRADQVTGFMLGFDASNPNPGPDLMISYETDCQERMMYWRELPPGAWKVLADSYRSLGTMIDLGADPFEGFLAEVWALAGPATKNVCIGSRIDPADDDDNFPPA